MKSERPLSFDTSPPAFADSTRTRKFSLACRGGPAKRPAYYVFAARRGGRQYTVVILGAPQLLSRPEQAGEKFGESNHPPNQPSAAG